MWDWYAAMEDVLRSHRRQAVALARCGAALDAERRRAQRQRLEEKIADMRARLAKPPTSARWHLGYVD